MIGCGIQCLSCDYPIHLDTYTGCSHACKYCHGANKTAIKKIIPRESARELRRFISGHRNSETKWCDWAIPIHWGANSDPFQPCEREEKKSLACLEIFAETKYPFIVSTKNPVICTEEPYISLLSECNVVFQISMASGKYDAIEQGASNFEERLNAASVLSNHVKRLIVRVQPFFPDCYADILANIPRYAEAGAYGLIIEGYGAKRKQKGMIKQGNSYTFPLAQLAPMFKVIREECHKKGMRFFCGHDGLVYLGDSLTCCGTEGLDGFKPNTYNITHIAYGDNVSPTDAMQDSTTSRPFRSYRQCQEWEMEIKGVSFAEMMRRFTRSYTEYCENVRRKHGE